MNTVRAQLGSLYEQIKAAQFEIDAALQTIAESQDGIAAAQGEVIRITALQESEFEAQQAELTKLKNSVNGEIAELVAHADAARRRSGTDRGGSGEQSQREPGVVRHVEYSAGQRQRRCGCGLRHGAAREGLLLSRCRPGLFRLLRPHPAGMRAGGRVHAAQLRGPGGDFPRVPASEAKPGDITWSPGRVGIYVGDGAVVNATHTGGFVRIHPRAMYSVVVGAG